MKNEIGKWYVDGFRLDSIITPIYNTKYLNNTQWKTVMVCSSIEEAKRICDEHNAKTK